jgi:hypothetical protein
MFVDVLSPARRQASPLLVAAPRSEIAAHDRIEVAKDPARQRFVAGRYARAYS